MTTTQLIVVFLLLHCLSARHKVAAVPSIDYPVKFAYINAFPSGGWSSASAIASNLGIPGHSTHNFNFIALTFIFCQNAPADTAKFWQSPLTYMGATAEFGSTNE